MYSCEYNKIRSSVKRAHTHKSLAWKMWFMRTQHFAYSNLTWDSLQQHENYDWTNFGKFVWEWKKKTRKIYEERKRRGNQHSVHKIDWLIICRCLLNGDIFFHLFAFFSIQFLFVYRCIYLSNYISIPYNFISHFIESTLLFMMQMESQQFLCEKKNDDFEWKLFANN